MKKHAAHGAARIASSTDEQIAPLFDGAPENVLLPGLWRKDGRPRVIITGSENFEDYELLVVQASHWMRNMLDKRPIIISGSTKVQTSWASVLRRIWDSRRRSIRPAGKRTGALPVM